MSAHVLLNLLNELEKRDKMRGLPSILHSFYTKWTKYENTLSHAYKIFLLHDMLRHLVLYNSSNTCLRFLT